MWKPTHELGQAGEMRPRKAAGAILMWVGRKAIQGQAER